MAGRIAGITLEIGGDTTKLQTALKGVDAQLRNMRGGLRDVDRLMKFNPTSTTLITQKQQLLRDSIEQTKGRLEQLKAAQAQMDAKGVDKNSDEYQRLQREIMATEGKLKNLEQEYAKVASVAGVQIQAAGQKMKDVGAKATEAGQAVTKNLTGPIVAMGAASVAAFADVDKGMDSVVKKTGATGQALENMKGIAKDLATSIPTDFQTAGDAVGQVNTRFKLTGDELESVAGQFVKFAKLNNTDVTTSINSVQSAMAAFGVETKDTGAFLDTLNAVGQETGADVNRLAQEMTTNAASLKAMGYSASDAAKFLGQLSVNGIDSSQVMAGLKKAFAQATKEGKPLDQKLAELQDTMKNSGKDTEAYQAALEVFGNRAGPALASAIRDGRLSLEELGTSMKDNVGNIDQTFENTLDPIDKFKMAVNQAKVAGADLGNSLLTTLTPMIGKLQDGLKNLGEKFKSLSPQQQEMVVKIGLMVAAIGPAMVIIGKMVSGIGMLTTVIGKAVTGIASMAAGTAGIAAPIMAAVAAIGALAAASYAGYQSYKKHAAAAHELTDEELKNIEALNAQTEAYKQAQEAADQKNQAISAEFSHVRELKEEYNGLVDANGKIAEKDQARAEVILGDLAKALGVEKSEIQGLINKNGKFAGSIDKVIAKKEAQAYLDANYDSYVKAIEQQTSANNELAKSVQDVDNRERSVAKAQAELAAAQNALNNAREMGAKNVPQLVNARNQAKIALDTEKKALADAKKAVDDHSKASADASNKIANYQKLQEAVQTGSMKKINEAMVGYQNNLKTATTATKTELDKQAKEAQKSYNAIKKAYDQGKATKGAVDAAKKRADAAAAEAAKVSKAMDTVDKKTRDAADKAGKSVNKIKGKFPVRVDNMFSIKVNLPDIVKTGVKKIAGANIPVLSAVAKTFRFAKAYDNPMLFNAPTMYQGAIVGDRGTHAGGEMIYGKDNLMKDIAAAVGGAGTVVNNYITVNGAESPEAWADRFVKEYQLQTRMA